MSAKTHRPLLVCNIVEYWIFVPLKDLDLFSKEKLLPVLPTKDQPIGRPAIIVSEKKLEV